MKCQQNLEELTESRINQNTPFPKLAGMGLLSRKLPGAASWDHQEESAASFLLK
jgi:hypothetical protein